MTPTRRDFMRTGALAGSALACPNLLTGCLHTRRPNDIVQIGIIGLGRIANEFEIPTLFAHADKARITAVCDFDAIRLRAAQERIDRQYNDGSRCRTYANYRELIADAGVDAVMICTPDHWHALAAVEAALAGKDIWVQKPLAQTIQESRVLADVVKRRKIVMQVGSQQRSWWQFHRTCELIRNGRIGRISRVEIGLAQDKPGGSTRPMPVPATFNYDGWLGPVGNRDKYFYNETRCHPQGRDGKPDYGRPGWITMEPFGWGMITNWGAHHLDIAQWALGMTESGPTAVEGWCKPLGPGLWDVHGDHDITYTYPDAITLNICNRYKNGIKFIGENGWIFVTRSGQATASDPTGSGTSTSQRLTDPTAPNGKVDGLEVSDPRLLDIVYGANDIRLHDSPAPTQNERYRHVADWLKAIRERSAPIAGAENGHRSNTVCVLGLAAMKLGRKLKWDPKTELFDDAEANARFNRTMFEAPGYSISAVMKAAGLSLS